MNRIITCVCAGVLAVLSAAPAWAGDIIISEIHYNPLPDNPSPELTLLGDYFEFVELKNTGTAAVDISGYKFVGGITYTLPAGSTISAGGYYIVSRSKVYFKSRYGTDAHAEYVVSKLSNSGETIVLVDASNDTLIDLDYGSSFPWPVLANGFGYSLVPVSESADLSQTKNWRNSAEVHGSPGKADPAANHKPIIISEILANTVAPAVDSIELFNPNAEAVDISGWKLSDKLTLPLAYTFPAGTVIQPGSYLVLAQGQMGTDGVVAAGNALDFGFGLSSLGEQVYLFSAANGGLTGFTDGFEFGASRLGSSISRLTNSEGRIIYAETPSSLGAANMLPAPSMLVFDEIHYAPVSGQYEYLKITNISGSAVDIANWYIAGVSIYKASMKGTIAAGESFYAVENTITPADFRTTLGLAASVKVFSFNGSLKNEGEEIALMQPTNPLDTAAPYYTVEAVRYDNKAPWPVAGTPARPIARVDLRAFGNEAANWKILTSTLPVASITGAASHAALNSTMSISSAMSSDPNGKTLQYLWTVVYPSGKSLTYDASSVELTFPEEGTYSLKLIVSNGTDQSLPALASIEVKTTGYAQIADSAPIVFPTVTDDHISIEAPGEGWAYRIETISGSPIVQGKLTAKSSTISLKSAKLGTGWVLVVLTDSHDTYVQKVFYTEN